MLLSTVHIHVYVYVVSSVCYHLQGTEKTLKYILAYLQIARQKTQVSWKKKHFLNSFRHTCSLFWLALSYLLLNILSLWHSWHTMNPHTSLSADILNKMRISYYIIYVCTYNICGTYLHICSCVDTEYSLNKNFNLNYIYICTYYIHTYIV